MIGLMGSIYQHQINNKLKQYVQLTTVDIHNKFHKNFQFQLNEFG